MRLNLPIRARLSLLYFAVLGLSFAAFFWICDIEFQRSIQTTVDNASRTNLETIQRLLSTAESRDDTSIRGALRNLANLWANGALLEVANEHGEWLFRSEPF